MLLGKWGFSSSDHSKWYLAIILKQKFIQNFPYCDRYIQNFTPVCFQVQAGCTDWQKCWRRWAWAMIRWCFPALCGCGVELLAAWCGSQKVQKMSAWVWKVLWKFEGREDDSGLLNVEILWFKIRSQNHQKYLEIGSANTFVLTL